MNQNKQLIILENFSVLSEDCIQSSEVLRDRWYVRSRRRRNSDDRSLHSLWTFRNSSFVLMTLVFRRMVVLRISSLQAYRHDFRHSLILHGHTVDGIGRLHGDAVVGNEDDLGFFADVLNDFHEAHEVCIVQRRIDLIHQ